LGLLAAVPGRALGSPSLNYTVIDLGREDYPFMVNYYPNEPDRVYSTEGVGYTFQTASNNPTFFVGTDEGPPRSRLDLPSYPTSGMFDEMGWLESNQAHTVAAYTEFIGQYDDQSRGYVDSVTGYIATKGTDGAWTRVADFGTDGSSGGFSFEAIHVNGLNQALVSAGSSSGDSSGQPHFELYDASSNTLLDLTRMLADKWTTQLAFGLDESGRILMSGVSTADGDLHVLLLTPDGVPIDPTPIPEPSTIAFIACAAIGYAVRRSRVARRPV